LDGAPNEHDRVRFTINHREVRAPGKKRQRHGTWEIIAANIERLRAMGSSPFILCTVTPSNHRTLRQLLDATIGWGVGMRLSLVRDQRCHALPGMVESILAELADLYAWLGERMPVDMPIDRFAGFAEWSPSVKKNGVCSACRNSSALDQDGNVASCQMRMDHPWGNTTAETFSDIFERMSSAEDNRYLSRPETRTGGCSVCYWKHVCAGGCPEHTRLAEGSQNVPSPWCSVYRELLPHYLRAIAVQMKRRAEPIVPALYADKK
jgi:radical SAM protein with 4Fe4S-binding SPASM domain